MASEGDTTATPGSSTHPLEGGLSGLGDGIQIQGAEIAWIVVLIVVVIVGIVCACVCLCKGSNRCNCACGRKKQKRRSQLPIYEDDRTALPAWNPNASQVELGGLTRLQSVRKNLFSRESMSSPLMTETTAPYSGSMTDVKSDKSRWSTWSDKNRSRDQLR